MSRVHVSCLLATVMILSLGVPFTLGQETIQPTTQPAATAQPPATQPAVPAGAKAITAKVIEVKGDCRHAPAGSKEWKKCKVGDEYPQETVVLTGIRSALKLQIGADDSYTAVIIEAASKTLLSKAYTTTDTKHVKIGVGYGRVRAGVVEGGLKSDFTVESPVATLSKRGTWDFGMSYERGTDRFEIFLLDQGLVEAFHKATGIRREVLPQTKVTQVMRRWLDESQFSRTVPVPDLFGQGDIEIAFNRLQQDGLRITGPDGGVSVLMDLSSFSSQAAFSNFLQHYYPTLGTGGLRAQPESSFGTGRGQDLIPLIVPEGSDLVQKNIARAGTYNFRRSVLENWVREHRRSRR